MVNKSYTVLVIEDIADWQKTLARLLNDTNYNVVIGASITEAKALLAKQSFDLAVLDIRLDEENEENEEGLDLAEFIKSKWPTTKIVILTGHGKKSYVERAFNQGDVDDFLYKDDLDKFIPTIENLLTD